MFIKLILFTVLFVALAFAGLAISMLVKKGGKFPDTHISHNREMRRRGISCAQHTDTGSRPAGNAGGCAGCSCG